MHACKAITAFGHSGQWDDTCYLSVRNDDRKHGVVGSLRNGSVYGYQDGCIFRYPQSDSVSRRPRQQAIKFPLGWSSLTSMQKALTGHDRTWLPSPPARISRQCISLKLPLMHAYEQGAFGSRYRAPGPAHRIRKVYRITGMVS